MCGELRIIRGRRDRKKAMEDLLESDNNAQRRLGHVDRSRRLGCDRVALVLVHDC